MNELPAKREIGESPQSPIALDPVVMEPEAIAAMERRGLVTLPATAVSDLRSVGVHVQQVGMVKIGRGRLMVTQEHLDATMQRLQAAMLTLASDDSPKGRPARMATLARMAEAMAQCVGKMTDAIALMARLDGGRSAAEPDLVIPEQTVRPFQPGQVVKPAAMVVTKELHIHQGKT